MIVKTLFVALAGYAVWKFAGNQRLRLPRENSLRKPQAENRWEGEGGALPLSGAQLGPEPSTASAT